MLGIVAGLVAGGSLIAAVERLGHLVYPPPAGIDPHDIEPLKRIMSEVPPGALLFVLLAWATGTTAGAWLAGRAPALGSP